MNSILATMLPAVAYVILLAVAAIEDIRRARIPNIVSVALVVLYVVTALVSGGDAIAWHLACGATVLAAGFLGASRGWLGAGDAKLIAALACWTGFNHLAVLLATTALAGGLVALILLTFKRRPGAIPYAPAIALGALAVLPVVTPGLW